MSLTPYYQQPTHTLSSYHLPYLTIQVLEALKQHETDTVDMLQRQLAIIRIRPGLPAAGAGAGGIP